MADTTSSHLIKELAKDSIKGRRFECGPSNSPHNMCRADQDPPESRTRHDDLSQIDLNDKALLCVEQCVAMHEQSKSMCQV
jgi:hypothetical protein